MKPLFKPLPALAEPLWRRIAHTEIFQPLRLTLLTLLFTVPQVPIQYPLPGSISLGGKALAQTSCPAGTSPQTLQWTPSSNLQDFLSQNLSVGGIATTFRFSESSPGVIDEGETLIESEVYGGLNEPNLRFNIGGNSLNRPANDRDSSPAPVGSSATLTITFAQPVTLASPLTFLDIDRDGARDPVGRTFQDRVTIRAVNGTTPVGVTGTALGTNTRVTNQGNSVLAEGINENAQTTQNAGNIQVTPAGAITQIQVLYEPGTEFGPPGQDETIGLAQLNICASIPGTGSLGDTVYNDTNGNGIQDTGEPGIGSVPVNLVGAGPDGQFGTPDDISRTTTTDINGRYSFPGLPAGSYRVSANNPPGLTPTQTQPNAIALSANQNINTVDFGFRPTSQASIGDTVFNDRNGNGVQDQGEPGIPNVPLTLTLPGPDGRLDTPSDNTTQTTTTNSNGNYSFNNLPPGPYRVTVTQPFDFPQITTASPQIDVNLSTGQTLNNVDFGLLRPPGGSIGDFVFNDRNGDRIANPGETGIPNATLTLRNSSNQIVATTTTNNNGNYIFSGLPLGNYTVEVTTPGGGFSATTNTTLTANLTEANQDNPDIDFGFRGGTVGAANTALRLVKRITNVFRNGQPVNIANFNTFVDDPNDPNDNILQQAGRPPLGVTQLETPLQSGDEVEYTIYYLAEGDQDLQNVSFCDLIPPETSYSSGEILVNRAGTNSLLTNAQDNDQGAFFTPLQPLPQPNQCLSQTNTKGAVTVNLGTITPDRNFGFLRFRVRID
ncbi:carboxypeptidase regulatory-like domain-containing protein [Scytonema hofmannii FACHB-248]|uniref:Carboxypeptidase regulatory-like domain-containing protein n=1 Tax=Scytonema hofmannii FACHB-248 TaxID=1842502 RepID=A0ABR8GWV8_9CYAN|nr:MULTISPECIES: SdrD B-like domain-containing protein [Nostocales]MBD2607546.1 carboxypeptidase regulatory-like domain-containing protein [Scytonema hofmannii FACHB-248]